MGIIGKNVLRCVGAYIVCRVGVEIAEEACTLVAKLVKNAKTKKEIHTEERVETYFVD